MRVAVIGANGQLGTDVCAAYAEAGHTVVGLTHADADIRDADSVHRALEQARADVVVNTAAMHNVEACEADPEQARAVNATGSANLASAGARLGFALLHISTDYVFGGDQRTPYTESDAPGPLGQYGKTKLEGERMIADAHDRHFIVRTSGLYGVAPCRAKPRGNFVQMMLTLGRERGEVKVVADEVVTPTYTADLARQLVTLTDTTHYGVYHATSQGDVSWFDYAATVFELTGAQVRVTPAKSTDFPAKAPRPAYSVLDNAALRRHGIDRMPHWRDSLTRYLTATNQRSASR